MCIYRTLAPGRLPAGQKRGGAKQSVLKKMCWHCRNDKYWISIATNVALLCRHMVFRASFVQQVRLQWYGGKHALSIFMNFPVVVIFVNPVLVYCEIKHYGATYNAINELCVYHTIQHPQNYTQGK